MFLFSCFTCFKRSGLQTAQNIFASIYTFSVPPSCPYKVRGPRRNSYNMVWCFVISCAYSHCHIAEDTPRKVLKIKFEFKVILSICVVFLFPCLPSCHIMPLQNDRFPSKFLQDGLALWFLFFSNMQLKTLDLDSSKLLGFLTPNMWFLPKNTDTRATTKWVAPTYVSLKTERLKDHQNRSLFLLDRFTTRNAAFQQKAVDLRCRFLDEDP